MRKLTKNPSDKCNELPFGCACWREKSSQASDWLIQLEKKEKHAYESVEMKVVQERRPKECKGK